MKTIPKIFAFLFTHVLMLSLGVIAILVVVIGYGVHHNFQLPVSGLAAGPADIVLSQDTVGVAGRADVIVVYAPSCGHCVEWTKENLGSVIRDIVQPGLARVILRPLPIDRSDFELAVTLACLPPAARLEAFRVFMTSDPSSVASGLTQEQRACVAARDERERVMQSSASLVAAGIGNVPTLVVSGAVFIGARSTKELLEAIRASAPANRQASIHRNDGAR